MKFILTTLISIIYPINIVTDLITYDFEVIEDIIKEAIQTPLPDFVAYSNQKREIKENLEIINIFEINNQTSRVIYRLRKRVKY